MAAVSLVFGGLTACTTPAYEYVPTTESGDLSVEQAQKVCRYEATQAMPYVEPFSVAYYTRENLIGQCLEAKGFEQRLIGQQNIYTGTVTP